MSEQAAPTMRFGKFKGRPISELPDLYLLWLGCLDNLKEPLLQQVLDEMGRRMSTSHQGENL